MEHSLVEAKPCFGDFGPIAVGLPESDDFDLLPSFKSSWNMTKRSPLSVTAYTRP